MMSYLKCFFAVFALNFSVQAVCAEELLSVVVHNPPQNFFNELDLAAQGNSNYEISDDWVHYDEANALVFFFEDETPQGLAGFPPFILDVWNAIETGEPGFSKYFSGEFADGRRIDFAFFNVSALAEGVDLGCSSANFFFLRFSNEVNPNLDDVLHKCLAANEEVR